MSGEWPRSVSRCGRSLLLELGLNAVANCKSTVQLAQTKMKSHFNCKSTVNFRRNDEIWLKSKEITALLQFSSNLALEDGKITALLQFVVDRRRAAATTPESSSSNCRIRQQPFLNHAAVTAESSSNHS
ncbi:hypothetical protein IDH44_15230 [Paenibacillus sp. IB182496]|uniref:Uncharacterized protein n=1 Tax=Paenibacillus sabuli TaxID=2772509 RepID=A0A927BTK9_9BACL|nr:hypothetical protein [Paenibacillus sabuli]MBD2846551.1 hypothetical protein [Paenibacillus sabuli]